MIPPILTLPREIRDKIYDNVISFARSDCSARLADCRALLLVNRQMSEEANDFIHRRYNFILVGLTTDYDDEDWWRWLRSRWPPCLCFDNRRPSSFKMNNNITHIMLEPRLHYNKYMITFMAPGAEWWEYLCGELATYRSSSGYLPGFFGRHPLRDWMLTIDFDHRPADAAVRRQIQQEVLAPVQDLWWGFEDVAIYGGEDKTLMENTITSLARKRWSSPAEFLEEVEILLDTGDTAHADGDIDQAIASWGRGLLLCNIAEDTGDVANWLSRLIRTTGTMAFQNTGADLSNVLSANLGEAYLEMAAKTPLEREHWAREAKEALFLGRRRGEYDETSRMRSAALTGWACDILGDDQGADKWLGQAYELFVFVEGQMERDELPAPLRRSGVAAKARLVSGWFERLRRLEPFFGEGLWEAEEVDGVWDVSEWF